MVKKQHLLAMVAFLLIPAVTVSSGVLFALINPEVAAGHPNYERNFHWLQLARNSLFFAMMLLNLGLWLLTCLWVISSKRRTPRWLALALFGPLGFAVLSSLRDHDPDQRDLYDRLVGRLHGLRRAVYELCAFVAIWTVAYECMVVMRELIIRGQALATGLSTTEIIAQQDADSGMWAFGEMNEVFYLVILLYLLRPILVNLAGRLILSRNSPTNA